MLKQKHRLDESKNKLLNHDEFLKRIEKTLYFGPCQSYKISRPLADYAAEMFSEVHRGHSLHRLSFFTVGKLNVTPCSLILAMIYFDRLQEVSPTYTRKLTPTELFLVSMMVSTKFYSGYDEDIFISAWAEYGNITVELMKKLEIEFLDNISWELYVSNEEFFAKLQSVERQLAERQGLKRGWLTYTELSQLLPSFSLAKQILNFNAIMAISYVAGVITIAGSFMLASLLPGTVLSSKSSNISRALDKNNILYFDGAPDNNNVDSNLTDTSLITDELLCSENDKEFLCENFNYLLNDDNEVRNEAFHHYNINDHNFYYDYNNLISTSTFYQADNIGYLFQQKTTNENNFYHFFINKFL